MSDAYTYDEMAYPFDDIGTLYCPTCEGNGEITEPGHEECCGAQIPCPACNWGPS